MSFLKNTDESINIYIIHENPESFEEYLQKIKKEEKINKIIIKKVISTIPIYSIDIFQLQLILDCTLKSI
jgi:phosphoenolpyruvate synthase/pyruvate phosphate dikinase